MARARNIKPGFFLNEELAEVEPLGRILFQALWCLADRRGRLQDRPKRIKAEALPYDDCDVDVLLDALSDKGFVTRYTVDEVRYIQIETFEKHQKTHHNETESVIPPPESEALPSLDSSTCDQGSKDLLPRRKALAAKKPFNSNSNSNLSSSDELLQASEKNADEKPDLPKPRSRAPDPIFDAFCDVLGFESSRLNPTERGKINAACKDVRDASGTPDDIRLAAERYRQRWPEIDMTAKGISGNWQTLLNGSGKPREKTAEEVYGLLPVARKTA